MSSQADSTIRPLALCLQPTCVKHRWIRTSNASHIYERPERIRAVLLGAAAAVSRLEAADTLTSREEETGQQDEQTEEQERRKREDTPDVSDLLGSLNISESTPKKLIGSATPNIVTSPYLYIPVPEPVTSASDGAQPRLLQTHPALQVVHSSLEHTSLLDLAAKRTTIFPESPYLKQLTAWALEAPEKIRKGECEVPSRYHPGQGGLEKEGEGGIELNQNDLYLAPGSVEAIEGCVGVIFLTRILFLYADHLYSGLCAFVPGQDGLPGYGPRLRRHKRLTSKHKPRRTR